MKRILVVVAVVLVAVSYFVWSHYFSRAGRVERAYAACVSKFSVADTSADNSGRASCGSDPSEALAKGMSDAMKSMVQGMSGAMGGATCGLIKEACKQDFDGPLCQAALNSRP
jgi:hypothetical protein